MQQIPSDNGCSKKKKKKYKKIYFFIAAWTFQKYINIPLAITISILDIRSKKTCVAKIPGFDLTAHASAKDVLFPVLEETKGRSTELMRPHSRTWYM